MGWEMGMGDGKMGRGGMGWDCERDCEGDCERWMDGYGQREGSMVWVEGDIVCVVQVYRYPNVETAQRGRGGCGNAIYQSGIGHIDHRNSIPCIGGVDCRNSISSIAPID
jgi:hypothetical protein